MTDVEVLSGTDTRSFRNRILKAITVFAFIVGLVASAEQLVTNYAPSVDPLPLTMACLVICLVTLFAIARVAHLQNNVEAFLVGVCLLAVTAMGGAVGADVANSRPDLVAPSVTTLPSVSTTVVPISVTTTMLANTTPTTTTSSQGEGTTHLADLALISGSGLTGRGTYSVGGVDTQRSLLIGGVGTLDYRIPKGKTFRATFAIAPNESSHSATLYVRGKRELSDSASIVSQFQAPSSGSIDIEVSVAPYQVLELSLFTTVQTVLGDPRVE